jgi:hypothetical protein
VSSGQSQEPQHADDAHGLPELAKIRHRKWDAVWGHSEKWTIMNLYKFNDLDLPSSKNFWYQWVIVLFSDGSLEKMTVAQNDQFLMKRLFEVCFSCFEPLTSGSQSFWEFSLVIQ